MNHKEVEEMFAEESMLRAFLVLSEKPFMGIHPRVDVYAIFCFEPLHCICFEVGRMLNQCVVFMLCGDKKTQADYGARPETRDFFESLRERCSGR